MSRLADWFRSSFAATVDEPVYERAPASVAATGPMATLARAGFEYGIGPSGITEQTAASGNSMGTDRTTLLNDLYDAFLACPWSWAAVNAIARTITGGGLAFDWDNDDGEGDQDQPDKPNGVLACERLLKWCNPREDIIQLLRSIICDLLVFGDAFVEVVWLAGIPVGLYSLDCPTTTPIADTHGNITGYVQVTEFGQKAKFEPHEVIHISLDAPRSGVFGVSPTYAAMLPIKVWLFAEATLNEIMRKGMPPNVHVDHPAGMSMGDSTRWTDQYMVRNVGPKNIGRPLTTRGGGTVKELQPNQIESLLHTLDQKRDEVLSTYGVPPAEAGVIESGNIGGGTGESQRKSFLVNTCNPIAALVLEKINFVLLSAFGIDGWSLKFTEVDMRDSKVVEDIYDQRLRNGSWTLNRYRAVIKEPPVDGGDAAVLVDRQNLVLWRDMETYSNAGIAAKLKGSNLEAEEPADGQPMKLVKPEPKPVPPALAAHAGIAPPGEDEEPAAGPPAVPPGGNPPAPAPTERAAHARPLRESWSVYSRRVRQAMAELPDDRAA